MKNGFSNIIFFKNSIKYSVVIVDIIYAIRIIVSVMVISRAAIGRWPTAVIWQSLLLYIGNSLPYLQFHRGCENN